MKSTGTRYCIKTCSSENTQELETLLNEMSAQGWEIYTMHEVEGDDGFNFNCIFARDAQEEPEEDDDFDELFGYKTQMQKMISAENEPFELCVDIQRKIKDKRNRINKIRALIDETSEHQRQKLNKEMSVCMEELAALRKDLQRVISPEIMTDKIGQDKICIKLSEENIELVNPDLEANLVAQTVKIRQKLAEELGYIIPKIRFENDEALLSNEFQIDVRGVCAFKGAVYPGCLMFFKDELNSPKGLKDAIKEVDFLSGKSVLWVPQEKTKDFWAHGLTASEVVARALEYVCVKYVEDIFDYNDINRYIELVGENNLYLIENIIPDFVSIAELKFILTNLIKERVSVKDLLFIFEKINDFADEQTKEDLLSKVRHALGRQISQSAANENNVIQAFELSAEHLKYFQAKMSGKNPVIRIDNSRIKAIAQGLYKNAEKAGILPENIVLIVPMEIRQITAFVLAQLMTTVKVIAREEIAGGYPVEILAEV